MKATRTSVLSLAGPTAESVGHQLHVLSPFSPSGELVSYGYDGGVYPYPLTTRSWVSPIAGNDDTVWILQDRSNRLVRWDLVPEPRVGRVLERRVAEFDADTAKNRAAVLDERGLWIIWHTRDPKWEYTGTFPGDSMPSEPPRKWVDGWLDLVDPATGLTIARHHEDGSFRGFAAGSSYVVAYHETDAGIPFLHIVEPRLLRGSGGRMPSDRGG